MFIVKARYYADSDNFGESFVLTSDNGDKDLRLETGTKVRIVALCSKCGKDALISYGDGSCLCGKCMIKRKNNEESTMH